MKYDLHIHTTASDGRLSPGELVKLARSLNVGVISVTDHDSVGGIDKAILEAAKEPRIIVVPGVEINTDLATGELHVLGYFIDYKNPDFVIALERIRQSRVGRACQMIEKLRQLGVVVEWRRVLELARGESICRPHIAQAILENGYVSTEREAFDKYIGRDAPAYVEREKIHPVEAVSIIKKAGGLPVLAHPADIVDLDQMLGELIKAGLIGLEAYYAQYSKDTVNKLVRIASRYELLTTGGSDYHHFQDDLELPFGSVEIPRESVEQLFAMAGKNEIM